MKLRLKDKVAIVTGGSSGIGRAIAIAFAQEGAKVAVADIRKEPRGGGISTTDEIDRIGGKAIFVKTDISKIEDIDNAVGTATKEFGRLDILVNNVGLSIQGSVTETKSEEWERLIDVNLRGVFFASKRAIEEMVRRGTGGKIISIASAAGTVSCSRYAAYCTSKAAIISLTRQMAMDYGSRGINVNAISPGLIEPEMIDLRYDEKTHSFIESSPVYDEEFRQELRKRTPIPRFGKPEDVVHCALFLASTESDFVTGQNLVVDGGFTLGWWTERR